VPAGELSRYLEEELHWPQVRWVGWTRRSRKRLRDTQWRSQETVAWISSRPAEVLDLLRLAQALRHHWTIENGIFYVRDVSYGEDRNHARITGPALSMIRNTAISLIRREGYRYMTDAWCAISAMPDFGLSLLLKSER
jgi:predicted transposase YbfD/YdcC